MSKWTGIGSLRVGQNGNRNFIVNKNVEIFVDGVKQELGQYRTVKCFDATDSVQSLLTRGLIDQAEADKRIEYIDEKSIKLDLVIPPLKD